MQAQRLFFAKEFGLEKDSQDRRVKKAWDEKIQIPKADSSKFHQLPSSINPIFVDTNEKMDKLLFVLPTYTYVGIDTESVTYGNFLGLIQIACQDYVFLLDPLSQNISEDRWLRLQDDIFNNSKILKICKYYVI